MTSVETSAPAPSRRDWFNHRRVHGEIGMVPPVEFEDVYHHENPVPAHAGTALESL